MHPHLSKIDDEKTADKYKIKIHGFSRSRADSLSLLL